MKMDCSEALERCSLRGAEAPLRDPGLAHHLATCPPCAREAAFMARVAGTRPTPPPGLVAAIMGEVRRTPATAGWWSGWGAAAAVLVLSLGAGLVSHQMGPEDRPAGLDSYLAHGADAWEEDEWYVAGAPVLEGLPDQMLLALLQEDAW